MIIWNIPTYIQDCRIISHLLSGMHIQVLGTASLGCCFFLWLPAGHQTRPAGKSYTHRNELFFDYVCALYVEHFEVEVGWFGLPSHI